VQSSGLNGLRLVGLLVKRGDGPCHLFVFIRKGGGQRRVEAGAVGMFDLFSVVHDEEKKRARDSFFSLDIYVQLVRIYKGEGTGCPGR
jgi:hypothetical protein